MLYDKPQETIIRRLFGSDHFHSSTNLISVSDELGIV